MGNLIDNALDAVANGGGVEVSAIQEKQNVVVRILDDWPGIPAEVRDRITSRTAFAFVDEDFDPQNESSTRLRLLFAPAISLANRFAHPAGRIRGIRLLLSRPPT